MVLIAVNRGIRRCEVVKVCNFVDAYIYLPPPLHNPEPFFPYKTDVRIYLRYIFKTHTRTFALYRYVRTSCDFYLTFPYWREGKYSKDLVKDEF